MSLNYTHPTRGQSSAPPVFWGGGGVESAGLVIDVLICKRHSGLKGLKHPHSLRFARASFLLIKGLTGEQFSWTLFCGLLTADIRTSA